MNRLVRFIIRYFFKFLYTLGLVFLLLFLSTTKAPSELGLWQGTPAMLAGIASVLLIIGVVGVYFSCQRAWGKTLRSLGLWTLLPGVIGILISVYGVNLIYSFMEGLVSLDVAKPIIDGYIIRRVPQIFILTIAYIIIGLFLYISGVRKRFG